MKEEFYKEYYHLEREGWWFVARKKILRDQVHKLAAGRKDLRIINVGAAFGESSKILEEFGDVVSLEYDKYCCEFVKQHLGKDFINGSITELPFPDESFDLVCAFDVVEHVQDDELAVRELQRVCKPGGHVFCTVPAYKFLWSDHDLVNQHVRRYTRKSFSALFKDSRYKFRFRSYFNSWLFPPIAVVRLLQSLFMPRKPDEAKSDFHKTNSGFITSVLRYIFQSETFFLRNRVRFPFGVSIMVIAVKDIEPRVPGQGSTAAS